jgi:hypothetical protein
MEKTGAAATTDKNDKNNNNSSVSRETIFNMAAGLWISKTLMAAVELEVFSKLSGNRSVTLNELQNLLGLQARPAEALSTALVSLGLLQASKNGIGETLYSNSKLSETFLDISKPNSYIGDIVTIFDKRFYKSWEKLVPCLKSNNPIGEREGLRLGDLNIMEDYRYNAEAIEQIKTFIHGMYDINVSRALALTKLFDFSKYSKIMDIGGLSAGVYAIQAVKAYPHLSADVILPLAPMRDIADEYIKQFSLQDKIETRVSDLFEHEGFSNDCDVSILSNIIHHNNEKSNRSLLKKIYDKLLTKKNNGGKSVIIISEWLLNDEKTGPTSSALMNLNMMVESSEGRTYSFAEISDLLQSAGFKNVEKSVAGGPADFIIGYK